jgi:hypothetical protein
MICITKRVRNDANAKINKLNYMSTDLRHDLNRERRQTLSELAGIPRAGENPCESRGWLKRQQHIIRMEAKGNKNYHSSNI